MTATANPPEALASANVPQAVPQWGWADLRDVDPEIYAAIEQEKGRQHDKIELIASENYVSHAVLQAMGSVLTNKYAEGYPGNRYYGGCEYVDIAEQLAIDRAKQLFGAEHANVQPHSGAQANMAVYFAVLQPGDTILGMSLAHGGHLTHGYKVTISGKYFRGVSYGVRAEDELLDYDEVQRVAEAERPKMIVCGASAYPRIIDFPRLRAIADSVGAYLMADIAHIAGLIAAGLHPSPIGHAHFVTSTTHKTLRGPRGGLILCGAEQAKIVDKAVFPGTQGGPLMHVIAGKAVAFYEDLQPYFKGYQQRIIDNAAALTAALVDTADPAGGRLRLVSGGTDNHLALVDVSGLGITGKAAEHALDEVGITVNKNAIPYDKNPPATASGIRVGSPAVTSRGFTPADMREVAAIIKLTLHNIARGDAASEAVKDEACQRVAALVNRYPVPGII